MTEYLPPAQGGRGASVRPLALVQQWVYMIDEDDEDEQHLVVHEQSQQQQQQQQQQQPRWHSGAGGEGFAQRSAPAAVQSMAANTTWSSPSFSSKISFTSTDTAVQSGFSCLQCPHLRATAQSAHQLRRDKARAGRS